MNCLCCAKPLTANETSAQWHGQCIRRFFGTKEMPCVQVSESLLEQLATQSTNKGFTVPGVQKKLSLHLSEEDIPRLTLVNYPTGYILKPQTEEYTALPEAEFLVMQMAKKSGIRTVEFALIRLHEDENTLAYITKRADRVFDRRNHCDCQWCSVTEEKRRNYILTDIREVRKFFRMTDIRKVSR